MLLCIAELSPCVWSHRRREALLLSGMRQMLAPEVRPEEAHALPQQRPAARLRPLSQELHAQDAPEQTPAVPQNSPGPGPGPGLGLTRLDLVCCCCSCCCWWLTGHNSEQKNSAFQFHLFVRTDMKADMKTTKVFLMSFTLNSKLHLMLTPNL